MGLARNHVKYKNVRSQISCGAILAIISQITAPPSCVTTLFFCVLSQYFLIILIWNLDDFVKASRCDLISSEFHSMNIVPALLDIRCESHY